MTGRAMAEGRRNIGQQPKGSQTAVVASVATSIAAGFILRTLCPPNGRRNCAGRR